MQNSDRFSRRSVLAGFGTLSAIAILPGTAQAKGLGIASLLGKASDSALDRLSKPGAFYGDEDIRIALPIIGGNDGLLGSLLGAGERFGILQGVTRRINDAAGMAAGEAKPIFRDAIDNLSLQDAPGIVSDNDGGTRYLRRSSRDALHEKIEPLVDDALNSIGVYQQLDNLAEQHSFIRMAGLSRKQVNSSVTEQGLAGIFSYMGREERTLRASPLKSLGGVLRDVL